MATTITYDRREWAVEPTGQSRRPFILRSKRGATLELVQTVATSPTLYPMRGHYMQPGRFRINAEGLPESF